VAAGGGLESSGAQLQRDGAADELAMRERFPQRMRFVADVIGDLLDRDVARECALARIRLPFSRRLDRALIDAARELEQPRSPFAESIDELLPRESLQVADGRDAHVDEDLFGDFADTGDFPDGQSNEKCFDLFRANDE